MSSFFGRFYRGIIVPSYHVLFVAVAIWGVGTALFYALLPFINSFLEWATGADFGPALTRSERAVLGLVSGFVLASALLAYRRVLIIRRRFRHVLGEVRHAFEEHLQFCERLSSMTRSKSVSVRSEASKRAREYLIELCGNISSVCAILTQCPCHTSVKSFDPTTGLVITRARDALVHNRERGEVDEGLKSFHYEENTAFERIINDNNYYLYRCNWLRLATATGYYKNRNPKWKHFYHATIVLPITLNRNANAINKQSVIGFVCVDNMRGGFNMKFSRAALLIFVVMLHHTVVLLGWDDPTTAGADEHA